MIKRGYLYVKRPVPSDVSFTSCQFFWNKARYRWSDGSEGIPKQTHVMSKSMMAQKAPIPFVWLCNALRLCSACDTVHQDPRLVNEPYAYMNAEFC